MKKTNQKNTEKIEFTVGSGNVYSDFGFPNAQEAKTKAELAILITSVIKQKKFTQQQAAELMGIDQPKVSKITRGLLSEFTIERLMKLVLSLGFAIEITPIPLTLHMIPRIRVNMKKATKGRQVITNHTINLTKVHPSAPRINKINK